MNYDLGTVAAALSGDPILALIIVLTLGATVVKRGDRRAQRHRHRAWARRAMQPTPAIAMAAVCNFVGLAGVTMVSSAVAAHHLQNG